MAWLSWGLAWLGWVLTIYACHVSQLFQCIHAWKWIWKANCWLKVPSQLGIKHLRDVGDVLFLEPFMGIITNMQILTIQFRWEVHCARVAQICILRQFCWFQWNSLKILTNFDVNNIFVAKILPKLYQFIQLPSWNHWQWIFVNFTQFFGFFCVKIIFFSIHFHLKQLRHAWSADCQISIGRC